eukprot:gene9241-6494_t
MILSLVMMICLRVLITLLIPLSVAATPLMFGGTHNVTSFFGLTSSAGPYEPVDPLSLHLKDISPPEIFYWESASSDHRGALSWRLWWTLCSLHPSSPSNNALTQRSMVEDRCKRAEPPLLVRWDPNAAAACPDHFNLTAVVPRVYRALEGENGATYTGFGICDSTDQKKATIVCFTVTFSRDQKTFVTRSRSYFPVPIGITLSTRVVSLVYQRPEKLAVFSSLDTILISRKTTGEEQFMGIFQLPPQVSASHSPQLSITPLDTPWLLQRGSQHLHPHFVCYNSQFRIAGSVWSEDGGGATFFHAFQVNPASGSTTLLYEATSSALVDSKAETNLPPGSRSRAFRSCELVEESASELGFLRLRIRLYVLNVGLRVPIPLTAIQETSHGDLLETWEGSISMRKFGQYEVEQPLQWLLTLLHSCLLLLHSHCMHHGFPGVREPGNQRNVSHYSSSGGQIRPFPGLSPSGCALTFYALSVKPQSFYSVLHLPFSWFGQRARVFDQDHDLTFLVSDAFIIFDVRSFRVSGKNTSSLTLNKLLLRLLLSTLLRFLALFCCRLNSLETGVNAASYSLICLLRSVPIRMPTKNIFSEVFRATFPKKLRFDQGCQILYAQCYSLSRLYKSKKYIPLADVHAILDQYTYVPCRPWLRYPIIRHVLLIRFINSIRHYKGLPSWLYNRGMEEEYGKIKVWLLRQEKESKSSPYSMTRRSISPSKRLVAREVFDREVLNNFYVATMYQRIARMLIGVCFLLLVLAIVSMYVDHLLYFYMRMNGWTREQIMHWFRDVLLRHAVADIPPAYARFLPLPCVVHKNAKGENELAVSVVELVLEGSGITVLIIPTPHVGEKPFFSRIGRICSECDALVLEAVSFDKIDRMVPASLVPLKKDTFPVVGVHHRFLDILQSDREPPMLFPGGSKVGWRTFLQRVFTPFEIQCVYQPTVLSASKGEAKIGWGRLRELIERRQRETADRGSDRQPYIIGLPWTIQHIANIEASLIKYGFRVNRVFVLPWITENHMGKIVENELHYHAYDPLSSVTSMLTLQAFSHPRLFALILI